MTKSTNQKKPATKQAQKTDPSAESVAVVQQPAKRKPKAATRRVPVNYTPRIPTARCPGC